MEDCLDAHLVAAALKYLEIKDVEEDSKFRQPLFEALPNEEQRQFIYSIARGILDRYIKLSDGKTCIVMSLLIVYGSYVILISYVTFVLDNKPLSFLRIECHIYEGLGT